MPTGGASTISPPSMAPSHMTPASTKYLKSFQAIRRTRRRAGSTAIRQSAPGRLPYLNTITVVSPTGTGASTETINYNTNNGYVTSLVDGNGNTHTFTQMDALHVKTTISDSKGNVAYSDITGYDTQMDQGTTTDGNGNVVSTPTYD